ncbi:MAG: carboxypeptidase regulatory-like domain-containing protein, partial [Paludibacteraceae bacterium]|nr:carboxypeptidase regulatory-like domain-containing protein [Paludibacteraceae bacterium]
MKKFFLGIFLLCSFGVSAETIHGSVIDAKGTPMPFVTISVLAKDSTLLTGTITDELGKYDIESPSLVGRVGEGFLIQASYIGYQTAFGGPDFVLREETERLAEVEVKAKKPLIERQMDKLVVNVSASPL